MADIDLTFDPWAVTLTHHAKCRYNTRRSTDPHYVEQGLRRLLLRAATLPLPPLLLVRSHVGGARRFCVGGFVLVMDSTCQTLITMWRTNGR